MLNMKLFLCCLISLLVVSCADLPHATSQGQSISDEDALVVATFHQFYGLKSEPWQDLVAQTHGLPAPTTSVTHYYITVLDKDPSPLLLKQFKTTKAAFHAGTHFQDGKGVKFSVKKITIDQLGRGAVEFEHYGGPSCGYGSKYYFLKKNGIWQFVKSEDLFWA